LRTKVELELYGKALLPEGRGDILGVLEAVDRLLTDAEWVLYELELQELVIPESLQPGYQRLVEIVRETCVVVAEGIRVLFVGSGDPDQVRTYTDKIDRLESESDHRERALMREVFRTAELSTGQKILLKSVVLLLGRVTVAAIGTVTEQVAGAAERLVVVVLEDRPQAPPGIDVLAGPHADVGRG